MDPTVQWLLTGPGWIEYRTRLDLLGETDQAPDARVARQAMLDDPQVKSLLAEIAGWPGSLLSNHKEAGHCIHKLTFLAELGLHVGDPGVDQVVGKVMEHQGSDGLFRVLMNVPKHFGGSGEDVWAWALCDAPLLAHALVKLGMSQDLRVQTAVSSLVDLCRGSGWGCVVSPELGKFRGPGRKSDPCPYATLIMLQVLAELPEERDSAAARNGAEAILSLWGSRSETHPYMFFMGTDFCKLKAPLLWYDILHVTDVLSRFSWLRDDPRLTEMVKVCLSKANSEARYTPESVWKAWAAWEFGQKKTPSRWLTFLVRRVIERSRGPA